MARSLLLSVAVAACALLLATDVADAGCRKHRRRGGGCGGCGGGYVESHCGGGYSGGCGGGYADGGCYGGGSYGGCGAGGCQGMPYDGQPIPDGGSAPPPPPADGGGAPPPPSASIAPAPATVVAAPTYPRTYTNVSYRRGLFGRFR